MSDYVKREDVDAKLAERCVTCTHRPCVCAELDAMAREMSDISEDAYCAGWMMGLEFDLYAMAFESASTHYGQYVVPQKRIDYLRRTSERLGMWPLEEDVYVPLGVMARLAISHRDENERSREIVLLRDRLRADALAFLAERDRLWLEYADRLSELQFLHGEEALAVLERLKVARAALLAHGAQVDG